MNKILWLDNDKVFNRPFLFSLEKTGFQVTQVFSLIDALKKLEVNNYDLLLLDVMLPANKEDEALFPLEDSSNGKRLGFLFYKKFKMKLQEKNISILIFTIREDEEIYKEFLSAGLRKEDYLKKSEAGKDNEILINKVKTLIERKTS